MLKQLLEYFVRNLVDKPELVTISEIETAQKAIIEIRVAPQDLAKVIGREGRVFKALRGMLQAADPSANKDIVVDVVS